jgi:ubiquinone/menaquinone biosynthesis C-methylase UbiE
VSDVVPGDDVRPGGVHRLAAVGFDRGADAYERARPSYPDEAVALIVDSLGIGPGRRVLDLAAGTGKLTRLLAPTGADVVAVEPVPGMRARLEVAVPGVEVLDGVAEALPLADGSVDAVVCAQAWHWFDAAAALAEVRRVLRPGRARAAGSGQTGLAVVFNIRDESVAWVRELTEVTEFSTTNRPHHRSSRQRFAADVAADGGYGEVTLSTFRYGQVLDEDGLVDRAASQSNVASMEPGRREAILDAVRRLARTHPDLAGRATFELPYETEVAICHRR